MSESRASKEWQTIMNATMKDEEWRAVKSPQMWKSLKQKQTLGLAEWSPLAQACAIQLIMNARSVEKIDILDRSLDTMGRIGFATPNIDTSSNTEEWEDSLEEDFGDELEDIDGVEPVEEDGEIEEKGETT